MTLILGIETSCDETAAALVEDGRSIRSNVILSQEALHRRYGGVVPELASREHVVGILPAIESALVDAGAAWGDLSAVAVSYGPGLAGSLVVGVNTAKGVAFARGLPLVGVNHLEGHVYANWLVKDGSAAGPAAPDGAAEAGGGSDALPPAPQFPLLCLIVSGGHTELVLMRDHGDFVLLGRTRDDAAGEAFDKVARIVGLGYPGGPAVQRAAETLRNSRGAIQIPREYHLTRPWMRGSRDFSFSGVKTAVLRLVEGGEGGPVANPSRPAAVAPPPDATTSAAERDPSTAPLAARQIAAAFQEAVVEVLVGKTVDAARASGAREIALAGGVAANTRLRERLRQEAPVPVRIPDVDLCTDNAAMVAAAGYFRLQRGDVASAELDVKPGLRLA